MDLIGTCRTGSCLTQGRGEKLTGGLEKVGMPGEVTTFSASLVILWASTDILPTVVGRWGNQLRRGESLSGVNLVATCQLPGACQFCFTCKKIVQEEIG